MSLQYSIQRIPTHSHSHSTDPTLLLFLAGKFSALRLSALLESPESFASTFEKEYQFSSSTWLTRLSRPKFHYFIATAHSHSPSTPLSSQTLETGVFVGSVQLFGPHPSSFFTLPLSGAPPPLPDTEESKYQMTALYSSPSHRGKGLAKMLIQEGVETAKQEAKEKGIEKVRVRIFIGRGNLTVRKLYLSVGFVETGLCTLAEAVVQNGDAEILPEDGGSGDPEKWLKRVALVMEWFG
ncbi:predicted protein [Sclerotinia sclerotiorum 1980 UF-70]|uniref:N-acetyltransferase domain-containing protein n=2 Tax=Sclerotinia sclerotiorum (strain ATCC 18683 / 1980 / Ss-1) TaxID=665079 RepID=A7ERA0_SCLS1|nr:predicted protein [Sclerotinia sclerotiorum 1980 UF-70]APA13514.1 hypothetical protein sscle_11g082840 [Sclerotinia sclerotiorum 1980 UF-70]EDN91992.1 predicted protein [Sclerotinia sclerotiorum 1980 UF-70]